MSSLNVVALVGRAGADPEAHYFESGACKVTLNLAVDDYGSREKHTHWIPLVAWGKTEEIIGSYVTKGKQVAVQGSLKEDTWEEKDGKKRKRIYVHVDRVQLLGSGKQTDAQTHDAPLAEEAF